MTPPARPSENNTQLDKIVSARVEITPMVTLRLDRSLYWLVERTSGKEQDCSTSGQFSLACCVCMVGPNLTERIHIQTLIQSMMIKIGLPRRSNSRYYQVLSLNGLPGAVTTGSRAIPIFSTLVAFIFSFSATSSAAFASLWAVAII